MSQSRREIRAAQLAAEKARKRGGSGGGRGTHGSGAGSRDAGRGAAYGGTAAFGSGAQGRPGGAQGRPGGAQGRPGGAPGYDGGAYGRGGGPYGRDGAGRSAYDGGRGGPGGPGGPYGPYGNGFGDDEYDDEGRTGWRKWAIGTLKWGSVAAVVLGVLGAIAVVIAYNKITVPQPNDMVDTQVSIVYYADGKTELDRIAVADGNRENVKLSQVPKYVQEAHIAAEDRTFYQNNGIDISGILRALKTTVTGDAQVGGSTITQQYVKNYFLTQDRTVSRKAKEILLAMKIDGQYSKDQILENYLNTIYYGRGAYGIQSAARTYFGKDVSKLTVPEGAVLASIINAPSLYDPAKGERAKANLEKRVGYVLDGMVTQGWLSEAERSKYTGLPKIKAYQGVHFASGPSGYLTAQVKRELAKTGLTDAEIDKGGLRIVTTIDKKAQDAAVKAVKDNVPKEVKAGLVAIKPGDGAIYAMYGGADYAKSQLNSATQAVLQAGSNFKPFAVLGAVREGISTKTKFDGHSPQEFKDVKINNFDHESFGQVDMRRMIAKSINTAFVALNDQVGPRTTRQAAIDAGIPESTLGLGTDLTNVLGTSSPRVIDMASAYSTIASQGVRTTPYIIKKVTSSANPGFVYEAKPDTKRTFNKDVTADTTDAMTATVKPGGTATRIGRELGRPAAGKTGTSEENKSIWFSGFIPQLSVSVGMYKPDAKGNPQQMTDSEGYTLTGATIPADVWLEFMKAVTQDMPIENFPKRAGVGDDKVPTPTPTLTTTQPTTTSTAPTTTQTPTKTKGNGKPTPTDTTLTPTTIVPLPTGSTTTSATKPGNGP